MGVAAPSVTHAWDRFGHLLEENLAVHREWSRTDKPGLVIGIIVIVGQKDVVARDAVALVLARV